jgi:hydrogenase maturation protease
MSGVGGQGSGVRDGPARAKLAIVGIGNALAGDDGVGPEVVRRLRELLPEDERVALHTLEGDLLEIADWLDRTERLVLVDAVAGAEPGTLVIGQGAERAWAPSFHQADIATVLRSLHALDVVEHFPAWEVWGITIRPPEELRFGLSEEVAAAAEAMVERLLGLVAEVLHGGQPGGIRASRS